ncbi:heme-binding protein [Thiocapsa imhoffii]|uniref:Heme-binding protein n=1 Tax=Thiocapsa imhoffii TaxID=382777 RepID=A0A9X0WIW5_9GAMM|nr:heme-binding protein [Thiocapsa imhoffii]MBK1644947.1 heme-binding protein [Thiocapsa imhoffii]
MKTVLIVLVGLGILSVVAIGVFVFVVQNVETPNAVVVVQEGPFEVRDYPALVIAETRHSGPRQEALSAGFRPLARYIFAKERAGDSISMTAPVMQQSTDRIAMTAPVIQTASDSDDWMVSFIMPSSYELDQLPAPDGAKVTLRELPAQRRAAVRFSGRSDDATLARQEAALREWMSARALEPEGAAIYAYYNDPFTPGFLRRNEVLINVARP